VPRLATRKVHRAFPWRNHQLCDVPENVPATTLVPAPRQLPGAKTTNENPSASCKLTEGLLEALELMRPLLCHLSYAAVPGAEQETYRLRERESSERE
jgi:hypothetical protein